MKYLGNSMVFGVRQIWVRILAQLHSLCSLDFTLVPVFPAFTPCGPPTTNFSLHWVLFICMWTCANIISKQTNLALCLLHLLQLPPRLLFPLLPSFSKESPTLPVSSSAIPTHSSVSDDLASAPTSPLTCFCHSHNDSCMASPKDRSLPSDHLATQQHFQQSSCFPLEATFLSWHPSHPPLLDHPPTSLASPS